MGDERFFSRISFPIDRVARFKFKSFPVRSGGLILRQKVAGGTIDSLRGVKGKPKICTRIRMGNVFGRSKEMLIHEDWIRLGDRIYERVAKKKGVPPLK